MSYNSVASAKNLVGIELTEEILNSAQSIIHANTSYRWAATNETRRFSGNGKNIVFLNFPITTFSYLYEIDEENDEETELDLYDDYDYDKETGRLKCYIGFVAGYNNYEVSYTYGYDASDARYNMILQIEAAIALLMKKNPLLLASVNLTGGDRVSFGGNPEADVLWNLIKNVPRPLQTIGL